MKQQDMEQQGGSLVDCLAIIASVHQHSFSRDAVIAGLPLDNGLLAPSVFERAAQRVGFASRVQKRNLEHINSHLMPVILLLHGQRSCVLRKIDSAAAMAEIVYPDLPDAPVTIALQELQQLYTGQLIYCRPVFRFDHSSTLIGAGSRKHWFWSVIAESRSLYRDILLAAVTINILAMVMPLYVMNIYDRVVPNHAIDTLWVLSFGVVIALIADLILRLARSWFVDLAASRSDIKLSASIMQRVLGITMMQRPQSTGSFASNLQSFESLRSFISSMTITTLVDLPFVLLFTVIIAIISWPLVIPIVIGASIVLIYALMAQQKMQQLAEQSMQASAMRNATLVESLSSLESVKSFNTESRIQSVWEKTTIYSSRVSAKMRFLSTSISSTSMLLQHLVAVSIMIAGIYLLIDGQLTQGGLIGAYMLSSRAMAPISQAAALLSQYHNAAAAMQSLNDIMAKEQERPEGQHWISRPRLSGEICFKHVSFRYPDTDTDTLSDISFSIKAGEHVVILGKNGSGKSTLEKLILGLYRPKNGSIQIDGVDIRQLDPAELRRNLGYVPQDIKLFSGSVHDNLTATANVSEERLHQAVDISGLSHFISQHPAGFNLQVGEYGQLLSGGQRQSVAIARALVNDPPILLLDEPTGALDFASEELFKQKLAAYAKGKTMIIITHRSSLLSLADRLIVLDSGKVVADGEKSIVLEALRHGRIGAAS